jgi:hypothetical protein
MAVPNPTKEKRSDLRIQRHRDLLWQLNLEDDSLITQNIINISQKGLAFKAPTSSGIAAGQFVRFTLSLNRGQTFECEGRVIWVNDSKERQGSMKQFGIIFLKQPPTLVATLSQAIQNLDFQKKETIRDETPQKERRGALEEFFFSSLWPSLIAGLLVVALTSAFLTAVWLYDQTHPADALAKRTNHHSARKLSSSSEFPDK